MSADLALIIHSAAFHGALTGVITAAAVDLHAVVGFTQWNQLVTYDWRIASMRWFIGAIVGALTATGYSTLVS